MKKFCVMIRDSIGYDIEAETEEQAIEIALGYWVERDPDIYVEHAEEEVE